MSYSPVCRTLMRSPDPAVVTNPDGIEVLSAEYPYQESFRKWMRNTSFWHRPTLRIMYSPLALGLADICLLSQEVLPPNWPCRTKSGTCSCSELDSEGAEELEETPLLEAELEEEGLWLEDADELAAEEDSLEGAALEEDCSGLCEEDTESPL